MTDSDAASRHPEPELAVTQFAPAEGMCGVAVAGAADLRAAPALGAAMREALDGGCRRLVVDLSQATFVDSSCLGTLLGGQRRMRDRGGAIAVVCTEPFIARIFELTLLDRVFLLCSEQAEAVERLAAAVAGVAQGGQAPPAAAPAAAPLAFDPADADMASADEIRVEVPASPTPATVPRLVLGGIASRFDLPVDRLEELQLAFEAVLSHAAAGPTVEVAILAGSEHVRVRTGRFAADPLADAGTRRAVLPLVDEAASGRDDAGHWVELVVGAARRQGNGTHRT